MENYISIEARSYPITAQHIETGEVLEDYCTISKEQSRASQLVGQSDREFITRIYARNGLKVLTIGKPQKKTLRVDLTYLFWKGLAEECTSREYIDISSNDD